MTLLRVTSWHLFLKYLDSVKREKAVEAKLEVRKHIFNLDAPYCRESGANTIAHRSPQEIIEEIATLDAEIAEVLAGIRKLL